MPVGATDLSLHSHALLGRALTSARHPTSHSAQARLPWKAALGLASGGSADSTPCTASRTNLPPPATHSVGTG